MRILLINQCFHPDHVASAQHLADLALALVAAGHQVKVIASQSAYDRPEVRYPKKETWRGVEISRIWTPGFGKRSKLRRVADAVGFFLSAAWELLCTPKQNVVIALTSPPLISVLAAAYVKLKGGRLISWVMDLNPDEAIAAGWLKADSLAGRLLSWILTWSLRTSTIVVALDEHMAARIRDKGIPSDGIVVEPPWTHDDALSIASDADRAAFRREHGLGDSFVVMYSGNHSPCHPLDTLLEAARRLSGESTDIKFVFVGGGGDYSRLRSFSESHGLSNVVFLPYQPREKLSASLGAAHLHIVVMGDQFVGIVHPCKIYNILGLGLPFLYLGPSSSHIADLIQRLNQPTYCRWAPLGDVDAARQEILNAVSLGPLASLAASQQIASHYGQAVSCQRWLALVEQIGLTS